MMKSGQKTVQNVACVGGGNKRINLQFKYICKTHEVGLLLKLIVQKNANELIE